MTNGLDQLALRLAPAQVAQLLGFVSLLAKWNKTYNLTAVREPEQMVTAHLLDCLAAVAPLGSPGRILDVGTGAGLPGIPLAIARPEWRVTMIDAVAKKVAFVQQAIGLLKLPNARVEHGRVESYKSDGPFDVVISRAFAELNDFSHAALDQAAPQGTLVAMKGVYPHDELGRLPANVVVDRVVPLRIPGTDAQRHLVFLRAAAKLES
ncbi:MAG TPA: 16S rRNA (guanine(527)-N(7))-methyltransferase RsmG [Usitatibacteraceae bacterium]|nr:16S rRNA (guanine(527)-N(7))-methyltransferase RsmG [Usitatibacteraceae bacterium]